MPALEREPARRAALPGIEAPATAVPVQHGQGVLALANVARGRLHRMPAPAMGAVEEHARLEPEWVCHSAIIQRRPDSRGHAALAGPGSCMVCR
jgi:hypothetical protein